MIARIKGVYRKLPGKLACVSSPVAAIAIQAMQNYQRCAFC
jgi:hypothetical protein